MIVLVIIALVLIFLALCSISAHLSKCVQYLKIIADHAELQIDIQAMHDMGNKQYLDGMEK